MKGAAVRAGMPGLAVVLLLAALLGVGLLMGEEPPPPAGASSCAGPGVQPAGAPAGEVAGYSGEQLTNAAAIMRAGADLGLSTHGQTLGVMTAMGESTLRVIDFGDAAGPDSRGLFQQRANGAWGSYADRMDPYISATNFFRALQRVPGWESLEPTIAAHRTQRNADPWHYERYWSPAGQVVAALGGGLAPAACTTPVLAAGAGGWTLPTVGRFTSGYGMRWGAPHNGVDLAAPLGTPIVAAGDGVVVGLCTTNRSPCTGYGSLITIDHGGGLVTRYAHMRAATITVAVGEQVAGGTQIAEVGSEGQSTGPHLHFEVRQGDRFTDPVPVLLERGVDLRGR